MNEKWAQIPGIRNFEASSFGQIRYSPTGYIIRSYVDATGKTPHEVVFLAGKYRRVETLVLWAFVGSEDRPVTHKDGNTLNNRLSNLAYK